MSGNLLDRAAERSDARRNGRPLSRSYRSRRRRTQSHPYVVSHPRRFRLRQFAVRDNLLAAFRSLEQTGGQAPGVDGITYRDLSYVERCDIMRALSSEISAQQYRPQPTRLVRIPKGDGRFRELRLPTILDRTVAKALYLALRPYLDRHLPGLRRSPWRLLLDLERQVRDERRFLSTALDIRDCFPSIRIDSVLGVLQTRFRRPDLRWLAETVMRGHDGPAHTTGLDQGNPWSPAAAEFLLHATLDRPWTERGRGAPSLLRYVDNITLLNRGVREARQDIAWLTERLHQRGLQLKDPNGNTRDLRDRRNGLEILGYRVYWKGGRLHFQAPQAAFEKLRDALTMCWQSNNPPRRARQVLHGWLTAASPTLSDGRTTETLAEIRTICRQTGFTETPDTWLQQTANQARDSWVRFHQSQPSLGNDGTASPEGMTYGGDVWEIPSLEE